MMTKTGLRSNLVLALALILHWLMAMSVSPRMGVTADEVVHLTGGYSYWKFNDYRLHPENGTLPMRIAALPLLGMDLRFPSHSTPEWMQSKVNLVGEEFFFGLGNPVDAMLARARLMIALIGSFTVWLTWRWGRGLFGAKAGWVTLGLAVFCPALLAHSGLATSDITMTACVLAALSLVWLAFHRATWIRVIGAALLCGLAFLSKMSGVLIVPLIAAMLVIRWLRPVPFVLALAGSPRWFRRRAQIVGATTILTFAIAAGSLVVLWAGYGFRFAGLNPRANSTEEYYFTWDIILDKQRLSLPTTGALHALNRTQLPFQESTMSRFIDALRQKRLLPEAYLWGFAHTYKFSRYRPAYFMGELRTTGWRGFFPAAFLLKTTLPALLLIIASVVAVMAARRSRWRGLRCKPWIYRATPLLLFFFVYWAMAVTMKLNIGHRHILPTYPIFYIMAGGAALLLHTSIRRVAAVTLLTAVSLHAADSLMVRPFYLSYFQPLVGGTSRGYHYFVDSSYDWGQGLPDLKRWLDTKKALGDSTPVHLTYFGADSPEAREIKAVRFGDGMSASGVRAYPAQLAPGWFVISATHFRRVYFPGRGPWTEAHETIYRSVHHRLLAMQAMTTLRTEEENKQLESDAMEYEVLQYCRLAYFLENRTPEEIIGGSLLAFKVTPADLVTALYGSVSELESRRASP